MVIIALWTTSPGLVVGSGLFGFFIASFGPTNMEVGVLIATPRFFNIGFGYALVAQGVGWVLGAPAAGEGAAS